jgi:catechol-2,3-dioxygenase
VVVGDNFARLRHPEPMRKMRGVGQLALRSSDPARVAEFYESAFGFRRIATDESGVDLESAGFELSFRRGQQPTRDGIQIGFRVETAADVDAWAGELARRGFGLVAPPSGDRYEGTRSFRLTDPDGRQVAVYYDYPR